MEFERDRKFLAMMNANKLPRLYVDELYTARLRAVEFFHRHGDIDLYRRNWKRPPSRIGKIWTPTSLRRIGDWMWMAKQHVRPDSLYVAAAGAWRGVVEVEDNRTVPLRALLRKQHPEGLDD